MTRTITIYSDDGSEREETLPGKWHICGGCDGHGKSSAYLGCITQSDRSPGGYWDDPDEFEEYMSGGYDRACDECSGSGKVWGIDYDKLSPEQEEALESERDFRRMEAAERRMGA